MANRKTGVIPLNFITEKDREIFTADELVDLMLQTFKYIEDQTEPVFTDRALKVKFESVREFLDDNQKKFDKKAQNLKQNRIDTESVPNRIDIGYEYENEYEDTNVSKEKEDTIVSSKEKSTSRFIPPTVAEVRAYCQERRNNVDPETFVDFYTGKGWMVGKNKMKDWKAAVRTWEKNRGGPSPGSYKPRSKLDDLRALYKEMENEGDDYEKERNGYMLGLPF